MWALCELQTHIMSVVVLASAVFLPAQTVLHVAPLDWVSQV